MNAEPEKVVMRWCEVHAGGCGRQKHPGEFESARRQAICRVCSVAHANRLGVDPLDVPAALVAEKACEFYYDHRQTPAAMREELPGKRERTRAMFIAAGGSVSAASDAEKRHAEFLGATFTFISWARRHWSAV